MCVLHKRESGDVADTGVSFVPIASRAGKMFSEPGDSLPFCLPVPAVAFTALWTALIKMCHHELYAGQPVTEIVEDERK